jgi:hypothetical protein
MGSVSEELSSEIAVVAVRGAGYPQRLPLLTRVAVEAPKRGGACWARCDNQVVTGTLERVDAERAYVRLATGLVAVPLECSGARYTGAAF